jgi:hypothetical protein
MGRAAVLSFFVLAGCQLISGLNELHEGSGGGAAGGPVGAGGTGAMGAGGTPMGGGPMGGNGTGGMCGVPPSDECEQMIGKCNGMCDPVTHACVIHCPTDGVCTMPPMPDDIPCNDIMNRDLNTDCVYQCPSPDDAVPIGGSTSEDGTCVGRRILCPHHNHCDVRCDQFDGACFGATIICGEDGGDCTVHCENGGCDDATTIVCGPGPCNVTCTAGSNTKVQTSQMPCMKMLPGCMEMP